MIVRDNMKDILANSLLELLKTKSFKRITINDIVLNCSTTRQTFYNYFQDKYDVIHFIYSKHSDICYLYLGNNYTWYDACFKVLNTMREEKPFYTNVINIDGQNSLLQIIFTHCYQNCIDVIKKKDKTNSVDSKLEFKLKFYVYGIIKTGEEWVKEGMVMEPNELAKNIVDCMPIELCAYLNK